MKTYREFVDKIKPKEFVAFFNAGGKPELNFDLRQQTNVNENIDQ
jgi:hypothetical protein